MGNTNENENKNGNIISKIRVKCKNITSKIKIKSKNIISNIRKTKISKKVIKAFIIFCLTITSLIVLLAVFSAYIRVYYEEININTICNHVVASTNILLRLVSKFLNNSIDSVLTESNMKVIIIAIAVIFSIYKFKLRDYLDDITSLEVAGTGIKLEKKVQALEELNKTEEEKIEQLEKANSGDEDAEEKIKKSKEKMDILNTMISDPYTVYILERFISKKIGAFKIPMNVFKQKTSIESIKKIFEYDIDVNSVKIKGIKEGIKNIVFDIYVKIKNESLE